jgi:integrase
LTYLANISNLKKKYPLPSGLERLLVRGSVNTKQHCPMCGKKFTPENYDDDGFYCPEHLTRPTRYYFDGRSIGLKDLYKDPKTGEVLKSYHTAIDLGIALNRALKEGKLITGEWLPEKITEKRLEYLADKWLKNFETEMLKDKKSESRFGYLSQITRDHLKPHFSGIDVREIDRDNIENFYHKLLDKGLSSRTIKDILDFLKTLILRYKAGDMPEFPEFDVVPAKPKQLLGLTREIAIMDKVPIRNGYNIAVLILLRTGMRIGEVCPLNVSDLVDGVIFVSKGANQKSKVRNARKAGPPKTYRISPELWKLLTDHIQGKEEDDYVFTVNGSMMSPRRLYRVFKQAIKDAGVKHISLQQASRHSTATTIKKEYEKKAQIAIAEQLGHTNLTTQKHYIMEN